MHLRVRQQAKNAQAVAEFLETHPKVETVRYGDALCPPLARVPA